MRKDDTAQSRECNKFIACTVKPDSIGASDQKMFSWHPWDFGVVFQVVGEP